MSSHFCRVGQIKPNLDKQLDRKDLENNNVKFIEVIYKSNPFNDLHGSF